MFSALVSPLFRVLRRRGVFALLASMVAVPVFPGALLAAQTAVVGGSWTQQGPGTSPPQRTGAAICYDAATGNVVLFGGSGTGNAFLSDTWVWDGSTWTQQNPGTSPAARAGATMVYDGATGNVVLFGGESVSSFYSDTWVWNGSTWIQESPASSPPARVGSAMAYDPGTGTVLLFGGFSSAGYLGDTWVWNGTTWTQQSPSTAPSARFSSTMSYVGATGTVMLFGGLSNGNEVSDTWTWNGSTWTQQNPGNSPPYRHGAMMAQDTATGTAVLFGGEANGYYLADTWVWNGITWTQEVPLASPGARAQGAMAYDPATGTVVLFSGSSNAGGFSDTWTYSGGSFVAPTTATGFAAAQTTPVYFTITGSGTLPGLSNSNVLLQGASGKDFTLGGGSTCTGAVTAGHTCVVNVAFVPSAPGLRKGAVELFDASHNLLATAYIRATGNAPLVTFSPGVLSTAAGSGISSGGAPTGDGGAATAATLDQPTFLALDGSGNLYLSDASDLEVRMVSAQTGKISTVAGGAIAPCASRTAACGDGGLATSAVFGSTAGLAIDGAGNLYIGDSSRGKVRMVSAVTGIVTTVAGTGAQCTGSGSVCGDGGLATAAQFASPVGLAVDAAGNLFISDVGTYRVRQVNAASGIVTGYAGMGTVCSSLPCGDGGRALSATISSPYGLALDGAGNLYIGTEAEQRVRKVTAASGIISTVAGTGATCSSTTAVCGDGGAATSGQFNAPVGVAVDAGGNLYIADGSDFRVRKVNGATGLLSTVAGTGTSCGSSPATCGNGGSATASSADLSYPQGLAVDDAGDLYVGDTGDNRVVEVSTTGAISFPTATTAGHADSTDGTKTLALNNVGNTPLTVTVLENDSVASFVLSDPLSAGCSEGETVVAGDSCLLGEEFSPVAGSPKLVVGSLTVRNNNLNSSSSVQYVPLTGTTVAGGLVVQAGNIVATAGTASVTLAASVGYGGSSLPTGAVTFTVNNSSSGVGMVTCKAKASHLNCTASYTASSLAAGSYTIKAAVAGDSNYSAGSGTSALYIGGSSSGVHVSPVTMVAPVNPAAVRSAVVAAASGGVPVIAVPVLMAAPVGMTPDDGATDTRQTCPEGAKDGDASCSTVSKGQPQ